MLFTHGVVLLLSPLPQLFFLRFGVACCWQKRGTPLAQLQTSRFFLQKRPAPPSKLLFRICRKAALLPISPPLIWRGKRRARNSSRRVPASAPPSPQSPVLCLHCLQHRFGESLPHGCWELSEATIVETAPKERCHVSLPKPYDMPDRDQAAPPCQLFVCWLRAHNLLLRNVRPPHQFDKVKQSL